MKKALIAIAALLVSVSAYAQGQINFKTHIASENIASQILNGDGSIAVGAFADLAIDKGNGVFTAMDPITPVPTVNAAGYVSAGVAGFASAAPGSTVNLVLRAWTGAAGSTFDTATTKGIGKDFSVTFAVAPNPPGDLVGITGNITLTPEPTTLALSALGLGALAFYRRKKA